MSEQYDNEFEEFYINFKNKINYGFHERSKNDLDALKFQNLQERFKEAVKKCWDNGMRTQEEVALNIANSFPGLGFSGINWALD